MIIARSYIKYYIHVSLLTNPKSESKVKVDDLVFIKTIISNHTQATQDTSDFWFDIGLSNPTDTCLVLLRQAAQATTKFGSCSGSNIEPFRQI